MRSFLWLAFILSTACAWGDLTRLHSPILAPPEARDLAFSGQRDQPGSLKPVQPDTASWADNSGQSGGAAPDRATPTAKQQPKRILGIMPNFRAVSPGVIPPPPTPKQAFKIATQNSFDYSSFIFVGITSALAQWTDAHPQLGEGMAGYGNYYWRGFLDKTDGNYWVIFVLPTVFRQDQRYYAKGEGAFWKRGFYAASRILIARNYTARMTLMFQNCWGAASPKAFRSPTTRATTGPRERWLQSMDMPWGATPLPTSSGSSGQTSQPMYCIAILKAKGHRQPER